MSGSRPEALILGGAGFLGYGITRYLAENRPYKLTVVDDFSSGPKDDELQDLCRTHDVDLIDADLSRAGPFDALDRHFDYVYVLASVVGVNRCLEHPDEVIRINTRIIANTTEWIQQVRPTRVLFASSSENYAATTDLLDYPIPTPEEVPLAIADTRHPRFTYAVTKILGESAFFAYGQMHDIHVTVVRYQNAYGPRMGFKHAVPHIIERIVSGENPVKIYGHDQTRAFVFRDDAAEGTVLALESDRSNQEVYHIGNDDEITIDHLTRTIGDIMGYQGPYVTAATYPGSVSRRCPDISKAREHFGYSPSVTLAEGLRSTIEWYSEFFRSGAPIPSGGFRGPDELKHVWKDARS